jgi:hypothetical protein
LNVAEAWFDQTRMWILGPAMGIAGALMGALGGTLAARGRARALVLGFHAAMIAVSALLFAAGVAAYFGGQPYGIWYGFGLTGAIGLGVFGGTYPVARAGYRQAEARRLAARDL